MTLIVHPFTVPIEERTDIVGMFNVMNNMGNHAWFTGKLAPIQEWIHEQPFTVIMYRGWWHSFYFDHPYSFLLTKMMYPEYHWHVEYDQPAAFDKFMDPIRRKNPYYEELERLYSRC